MLSALFRYYDAIATPSWCATLEPTTGYSIKPFFYGFNSFYYVRNFTSRILSIFNCKYISIWLLPKTMYVFRSILEGDGARDVTVPFFSAIVWGGSIRDAILGAMMQSYLSVAVCHAGWHLQHHAIFMVLIQFITWETLSPSIFFS